MLLSYHLMVYLLKSWDLIWLGYNKETLCIASVPAEPRDILKKKRKETNEKQQQKQPPNQTTTWVTTLLTNKTTTVKMSSITRVGISDDGLT